jgi:hypothetical protein
MTARQPLGPAASRAARALTLTFASTVLTLLIADRGATGSPSLASTTEPKPVGLTLLGLLDPGLDEALREVARAVGVRFVPAGELEHTAASVTLDLRAAEAIVTVTDGAKRPLTRRSLPRGPSPEVLREEITIVLQDALSAALAPPPPSLAPPQPATSALPPSSAAAPSADPVPPGARPSAPTAGEPSGMVIRADLAAVFSGRGRDSAAGAVLGAGLASRVTAGDGRIRLSLWLSGQADAPYTATARQVDLHVTPYALRLLPGVTLPAGQRLQFDVLCGVAADLGFVSALPHGPSVAANDPTLRASPLLTGAVGARLALGGAVLSLTGGADVDLTGRRYVVAAPAGNELILSPWRVRPFVLVGLGVPFLEVPRGP